MRKLCFIFSVLAIVACHKEDDKSVSVEMLIESFEGAIDAEYAYGYESDVVKCEYFYNEEYYYWGGFVQSKVFDRDAANGKYENQYAVYNTKAASGESFLLYYYDSYSEPCDMVFADEIMLKSIKLNMSTYAYASITDEDINTFARKFDDGDFLKVIFTALDTYGEPVGEAVECYVVDYRDGKRFIADDWHEFQLGIECKGSVRVAIETSDVGEYGANTPLYICMDDLYYTTL